MTRNRLGVWSNSWRITKIENSLRGPHHGQGIKPRPKRGRGTWDEFVKIHAETLWQVDFFSKMTVTQTGLKQAFALAFLHVESRRVFCSPATFKPDKPWMILQAESMLAQAQESDLPVSYLIRYNDICYVVSSRQSASRLMFE